MICELRFLTETVHLGNKISTLQYAINYSVKIYRKTQ